MYAQPVTSIQVTMSASETVTLGELLIKIQNSATSLNGPDISGSEMALIQEYLRTTDYALESPPAAEPHGGPKRRSKGI